MSRRHATFKSRTRSAAVILLASTLLMAGCGGSSSGRDDAADGAGSSKLKVKADPKLTKLLPAEFQDGGAIKVGTEALYPPYEYLDKDGQTIIGLDPDLLDAIAARLGVKVKVTNTAFDGLLPALDGGRFDMVSAAVSDTLERQKKYDFVDYYKAGQAIVVAAGNPKSIEKVPDMCGKAISVLISSAQEALLKQFNKEDCKSDPIDITALPSDQDALIQVQSKRADASFTQEPVGRYNAKQIGGGKAFEVANSEPLFPNMLGFVFDKGGNELRDAWQASLQSLMDDGTYLKILKSHGLESGTVDKAVLNAGTQ